MAGTKGELELDGRKISVSNLDKVMFPATGFTKANVIDYYIQASPFLLPHLKDRPLTMIRYPNGVDQEHFFEKDAPSHTPDWVTIAEIPRKSGKGSIRYVVVNDLPSLIWTANLANLEMHTVLGRSANIQQPTSIVFDLDPGEPADILNCAQSALWLMELLAKMKLKYFTKVSASKGLQLYVPLNTPADYETTSEFARNMAQKLEDMQPELIVSSMDKALRKGKVLIDWSQNSYFKTTVCVYSLRAKREQPYVSMPVKESELKEALKKQDPSLLFFAPEDALKRMKKSGDLFEPVLKLKQKLPAKYESILERTVSLSDPLSSETRKRSERIAPMSASRKSASNESRGGRSKTSQSGIDVYNKKRDFKRTPEPAGEVRAGSAKKQKLFVIQKHQASHLHYDFRLEMQGVLRSWAVPKGPPALKSEKRLAMHVEDHPMDYARFEGIIAPGNYGAGTVMVWDIGTYEIEEDSTPEHAYYAGKMSLVLNGKKLKGRWTLVRMGKDRYGKESWLLMKHTPEMKPLSARQDDSSALTGRTMKQIAADNDAHWKSNRKTS